MKLRWYQKQPVTTKTYRKVKPWYWFGKETLELVWSGETHGQRVLQYLLSEEAGNEKWIDVPLVLEPNAYDAIEYEENSKGETVGVAYVNFDPKKVQK